VASAGAARMYVLSGGLYGCLGARRTRLGAAPSARPLASVRVALFALSPGYAGIATATTGVDTFSSVVSVVDLRSGATLASAPATTPERRAESFVTVRSIAVDPRGTVAWIGARSAVGAFTAVYEVHTLTRGGRERLLASSTEIAPGSLRLDGETLHWLAEGRTASATL
jgi:hypothetical protein